MGGLGCPLFWSNEGRSYGPGGGCLAAEIRAANLAEVWLEGRALPEFRFGLAGTAVSGARDESTGVWNRAWN